MVWIKRLALAALLLLALAVALAGGVWTYQGGGSPAIDGVTVDVDPHGIPTIAAPDWESLVEAQGFVTASERMWQMDLGRRAAAGRLSEWFGPGATEYDRARRLQDWSGLADEMVAAFPEADRSFCEAYARGVNAFIDSRPRGWGIEYLLLGAAPEPWRCADTALMTLNMAEQLTDTWDNDVARGAWRGLLDPEWEALLFPWNHPWERPIFGLPAPGPELPSQPLPPIRLSEIPGVEAVGAGPQAGSNAWTWRGASGAFLANDPHLGAEVPHLWYLVRLRISAEEWAVGASIPGVPGVILGMNPDLAWGFTNLGEDVDDALIETLSDDGARYVAGVDADGEPAWAAIERRQHTISVKDGDDVAVESLHTSRGPLLQVDGVWYSRRWLPQETGVATLASLSINRARSWDQMNAALDRFPYPSQNVSVMDRAGGMGYRASGRAIWRAGTGAWPLSAAEGDWRGVEPPSERPRIWLDPEEDGPIWIVTANQRIWSGDHDNRWTTDRRAERIERSLGASRSLTRADMEALQMDTESRFHRLLLGWIDARASPGAGADVRARWAAWGGQASQDPATFTEALAAEGALREVLVARVVAAQIDLSEGEPPRYRWRLDDAWMVATLEHPEGAARFGLDERELADHLLAAATAPRVAYPEENRWRAQHPFVGRVPVLGDRFAIDEPEQVGYGDLVRMEAPRFGASLRAVWDLSDPAESTWITPVGQSGHARSPHYADLQALFHADQRLKVFATSHDWGF